ncbi:AAA family ATPase [Actinoplanes sp. NPDC049596]|uniref:AAA family ATPase n=1 Tax=unclassified Actinoplanes TaxID=2626549 RepID=UPI003426617C
MRRALILIGVSGVGKSTVAQAIGELLTDAGHTTGVIDTDALAQFGPPPSPANPDFYDALKCANLAAVWVHFRDRGAQFVVVSANIDRAGLRNRYVDSLDGCEVQVVRLTADLDTIRRRLQARDGEVPARRHLNWLADREAALNSLALEDFTVANNDQATTVARLILTQARWPA